MKQQVARLNIVSFLSWLLWCAAKARLSIFRFPVSIAVLIVPLILSIVTNIQNRRLPVTERLSWASFGYRSFWHPMCTMLLILCSLLIEIGETYSSCFVLGALSPIGTVGAAIIFVVSFIEWMRLSR